jgi:hypothetical protein
LLLVFRCWCRSLQQEDAGVAVQHVLQEVSRSIEGPLRVCLFFAAVVAAFVMAKGASSSKQEGTASTEQKAVEAESKRLLDLSFSRGVLSQNKAHPANPLRPSKAVLKCNGKDIVKKGHRKNKYLFAFPGLVAPVAGGKFGDLTQLDSKNPILYVDFPQACCVLHSYNQLYIFSK